MKRSYDLFITLFNFGFDLVYSKRKRKKFLGSFVGNFRRKSLSRQRFLKYPPLIFLLFTLSAIALAVALQKPQEIKLIEEKNLSQVNHLFDMSPSVSQPMSSYISKVKCS